MHATSSVYVCNLYIHTDYIQIHTHRFSPPKSPQAAMKHASPAARRRFFFFFFPLVFSGGALRFKIIWGFMIVSLDVPCVVQVCTSSENLLLSFLSIDVVLFSAFFFKSNFDVVDRGEKYINLYIRRHFLRQSTRNTW